MVLVCENYLDLMELNKFVFIIVVYFLLSKELIYSYLCFFSLFTKIIIYLSFHLPFLSITIFISIPIFIYIIIIHYSSPSLKHYNFQYFLFCRLASLVKQQQKYFLSETFKKWKLYSSFSRKAEILQKEKGICN